MQADSLIVGPDDAARETVRLELIEQSRRKADKACWAGDHAAGDIWARVAAWLAETETRR